MIKTLINIVFCKVKGHNLVDAGKCPFTGNEYVLCTKCESMIVKNENK
jgi:hypothetical protein